MLSGDRSDPEDAPCAACTVLGLPCSGDCPCSDWPAYARWIAAESAYPAGAARYWTDKYLREHGRRAPRSRKVPAVASFPRASPADRRVRVGVVSPCCYLGGAERWISDLLDHCDPARIHWVGIVTRDPTDLDLPTLHDDWASHAPVLSGAAAVRQLAAAVDVLVAWGVCEAAWGIRESWLAPLLPPGLPVIEVSHGSIEHPEPASPSLPGSIPVAVSRPALRGLARSKRERARIILNGVAPDRISPARPRADVLASWGLAAGTKVAGWLGRLSHEKGPERFMEGVGSLPGGWAGVMVGSGLHGAMYREKADQLAPGRIVFAGATDDVGSALAAFDCLVMSSDTEACSLAAAEAWLAGCPLVSTPVGLLEDHPSLARIMPRKPSGPEVAAAILADSADPEGRSRRIHGAREFAESRLDMGRFGREWTDLIVSASGRPTPLREMVGPYPQTRASERTKIDPAVRDAVNACPDRGPVLPISMQDDCGCKGKELSECRAGRGKVAGRVTLADCLACRGDRAVYGGISGRVNLVETRPSGS